MTIIQDGEIKSGGFAVVDIELADAPSPLKVAVRFVDYDDFLGEDGEHVQRPYYFALEFISAAGGTASYSLAPNITHRLRALDIIQLVAEDGRRLTSELDWPNIPPSTWIPGQPVPSRASLLGRLAEATAILQKSSPQPQPSNSNNLAPPPELKPLPLMPETEHQRRTGDSVPPVSELQQELAPPVVKAAPPPPLPDSQPRRRILAPLLAMVLAGSCVAAYYFGLLPELTMVAHKPTAVKEPEPALKPQQEISQPPSPPAPDAETVAFDKVKTCLDSTAPCDAAQCTREMAVKFDKSRYDYELWQLIEDAAKTCRPLRMKPPLAAGKYQVRRGWKVSNFTNCKADYPTVEITVSARTSRVEFTSGGTRWSGEADTGTGMIDFVEDSEGGASQQYATRAVGHWTGAAMVSRVCGVGTLSLEPVK